MEGFARPRIYISKCITFEPVRYSGEMISSDFVSALRPHVDAITHCPEVEIGLGIPRKTLRIVADDREMKKLRLIQPDTGLDFTEKMKAWTQKTLDSLPELDGFILKGKSPSSGAYDVKIYPAKGEKPSAITGKASGFFGGAVLERFPEYPVEDEGRLTDEKLADSFLKRIFALAGFRTARDTGKISALMDFHASNKLLFMSYNQKYMREMGRILAASGVSFADKARAYLSAMRLCMAKTYKTSNVINVFEHALGYFSEKLSSAEKKYFINAMNKYRQGKAHISVPLALMKSYIVRFKEPYLEKQSFFLPYPEDIMERAFRD